MVRERKRGAMMSFGMTQEMRAGTWRIGEVW